MRFTSTAALATVLGLYRVAHSADSDGGFLDPDAYQQPGGLQHPIVEDNHLVESSGQNSSAPGIAFVPPVYCLSQNAAHAALPPGPFIRRCTVIARHPTVTIDQAHIEAATRRAIACPDPDNHCNCVSSAGQQYPRRYMNGDNFFPDYHQYCEYPLKNEQNPNTQFCNGGAGIYRLVYRKAAGQANTFEWVGVIYHPNPQTFVLCTP
ncbi:hypothetical protein QBC40DRAFT_75197 [Triangularia verruculosa]|uniref:Uncharacterized protein n=1 Tax=Triangularia verruculosa TaxID=2587418 RepID=A0AAN7B060_9PEZI|nr:hypothetical protein QBC40DRAFT_75197 [Triangularia verruculosa]